MRELSIIYNDQHLQQEDIARHFQLAQKALEQGQGFAAVALYRTALALKNAFSEQDYYNLAVLYLRIGLFQSARDMFKNIRTETAATEKLQERLNVHLQQKDEGLMEIPHHTYIRNKVLAEQLRTLYPNAISEICLLDIGGGAGFLASFLPEIKYVLAEPAVNGISAENLPFSAKSFDCVVACHVFEHIPAANKAAFLDRLCSIADSYVALLNPFLTGDPKLDGLVQENQQLVWEFTHALWAKEHIDCGLPALDFVKDYTKDHQYSLNIIPNNSRLITLLAVYVEVFAASAGRAKEYHAINRMLNNVDPRLLHNSTFPNDYTCIIGVNRKFPSQKFMDQM